MSAPKNISELLERWGLKEPGPSAVELELQRRSAQDRAAKEAAEEAEFAASEEGRQQAEYDRSLAYAKAPHYAPFDQLSTEDKRLVLQDQADARQRALAKELGITLGKTRTVGGGSTTGKTEIRKPTAAEERASEQGIGYTGDLTTAPFGQMDLGADVVGGAVRAVKERPTLPAEIVAYPASVAGGVYDLVVQAMDDNPNLTPAQRRTGAVLAAAAFIPGGKAAKAADEAAEAAAEAAKAGTKGAKEGAEKASAPFKVKRHDPDPLDADDYDRALDVAEKESDEAHKLAKKVDMGITRDRDLDLVAYGPDGKVVGATWKSFDGENYAFDVAVDPAYQRQGLGSTLTDDMIDGFTHYTDMGDDVTMRIHVTSPEMEKMLQRRGFKVIEDVGTGSKIMAKEGAEKVAKEGAEQAVEGAEEISDAALDVLRTGQGDEVLRALEELGYSPSQARLRVESGEGMPILEDPQRLRVRQSYIDQNLADIAKRRAQAESSPAAAREAAETTATADKPTYLSGILPVQEAPVSRNVRGLSDVDDAVQQGEEIARRAELDVGLAKDQRAVDIATLELPDAVRRFAQSRRYNLSPEETRERAETIRENGGVTYDMSKKTAEKTGYSVAPFKATELRLAPEEFTSDTLKAYVQTMEDLLDVDGVHLGAWFDGKTNKYVLDVSIVAPNTPAGRLLAARLAKNGDQDAVFHLDTFDEIKTPDLEVEFGEEILQGATTPEYEAISQVLDRVTRRVSPEDTKGLAEQYRLKPQEVEEIRAFQEKMVRSRFKRGEEVAQDILDQYPNVQTPPAPLVAINLAAPEILKRSRASFTLKTISEDKNLHNILDATGKPYVPEGTKIQNNDVLSFLDDRFKKSTGATGPLDVDDPLTAMVAQNQLMEEFVSQLADTKEFLQWYTDDVREFLRISSEIFPELKTSEVHRMTLLNIASYTSNGVNPIENGRFALASYAELTQKGFMTGRNPFSSKDGMLAGYGTRGSTVQKGLALYNSRIRKLGLDGAARELLELNSKRGIREARQKSGFYSPDHQGPTHKVPIGTIMPNLYGNGPKIGTYGGNLMGVPGVTYDVWMSRQALSRVGYGRLMQKDGNVFLAGDATPNIVKQAVNSQRFAEGIYSNIAKATGFEDFQVQALLWFYEQRLYRTLGVGAASGKLSEGAAKFVRDLPNYRFLTPNGYAGTKVSPGGKGYPVAHGEQKARKAMESVRSPRARAKAGEGEYLAMKKQKKKSKKKQKEDTNED